MLGKILSSGGVLDEAAVYEIDLPPTLSEAWTVTRRPFTDGTMTWPETSSCPPLPTTVTTPCSRSVRTVRSRKVCMLQSQMTVPHFAQLDHHLSATALPSGWIVRAIVFVSNVFDDARCREED